mgnify:CR=1 FL=1
MKDVISNQELRKVIIEATDLLCDAVGSTLGPSGNNVLINTDDITPYITNDGVTIASAIESEDKKINTVLEIAKEASLKTNEVVGDGTTTTLVLLQAILKESFKEIDAGKNPIVLKKGLNDALEKIINLIQMLKRTPSKKDYISIASISANDKEIGLFLTKVYSKMKGKNAIRLEESSNSKTYYEIKKGYNLEIDNISNLYFQDYNEINLSDVYILILKGYLDSLEQISDVINEGLTRNKSIVIFAEEFNVTLNEELLVYYLQEKKNIYLFKLPDYGSRKEQILEDVSILSLSNIKNINYENVYWNDLGKVRNVLIRKDEVIIVNENEKVKRRLQELKVNLRKTHETYEKEFLENRIAKLNNGIATIYVGANTRTEAKEKIMRFEDALWAMDMARNGIVVGEGITFLFISEELSDNIIGEKVIKEALKVPFKKIMINSGENFELRLQEIKEANYEKVFNFKSNELESVQDTVIVDPVLVIIEALTNAVSIASMLITTNYLVINENNKSLQTEI